MTVQQLKGYSHLSGTNKKVKDQQKQKYYLERKSVQFLRLKATKKINTCNVIQMSVDKVSSFLGIIYEPKSLLFHFKKQTKSK